MAPVFRQNTLRPRMIVACGGIERSLKEVSKTLLLVWTVVEMNLQVNRMLALALVATEVNVVGRHLACIPQSRHVLGRQPACACPARQRSCRNGLSVYPG